MNYPKIGTYMASEFFSKIGILNGVSEKEGRAYITIVYDEFDDNYPRQLVVELHAFHDAWKKEHDCPEDLRTKILSLKMDAIKKSIGGLSSKLENLERVGMSASHEITEGLYSTGIRIGELCTHVPRHVDQETPGIDYGSSGSDAEPAYEPVKEPEPKCFKTPDKVIKYVEKVSPFISKEACGTISLGSYWAVTFNHRDKPDLEITVDNNTPKKRIKKFFKNWT